MKQTTANKSSAPTNRQKELLAKEDWRFHAIDFAGTGLGSIATTELIQGRILSFSLPSAPALFLNLARASHERRIGVQLDVAFIEHPVPHGTWPEDHKEVFNFFESFAAEIIFSLSAIEAFANESIPATFKYAKKRMGKTQVLRGVEIERSVSLDEKLRRVIPQAHHIDSPAGTATWGKYVELKRIRDRLTHLKTIDRKSSGPEHQTIWGLLLAKRTCNFTNVALDTIGAFPSLVNNRRWFRLALERLRAA